MKTIFLILLSAFLLTSCKTQKNLMDEGGDGIEDRIDLNPEINDYLLFQNMNNELA